MQPESARSLFGSQDGTPSCGPEQERDTIEVDSSARPPDADADSFTSLVEYIEDCGSREVTCPKQGCVTYYDLSDDTFHIVRTTCKTWGCSYCGRIRRKQLAVAVESARPNRFVTLTSAHHSDASPREVYDQTRRQISELVKTYRRDGLSFEYLRCMEVTATGYPHYHLLVRSPYLDQKELSHRWCSLTSAFIVDVRALSRDEKAIRYVMKYLGKQTENPFTTRRLSWSRNFFPKDGPQPESDAIIAKAQRHKCRMEQYDYWISDQNDWIKPNQWHWYSKSHKPKDPQCEP